MRRKTWDEMAECVDCGIPVDVDRERGYRSRGEWVLCWSCALDRGAHFDEDEDRWTVPPDLADLPPEVEHGIR